jgi:2-C-methyl-D-erythritol 2,4-cyclodiphosphate synthase
VIRVGIGYDTHRLESGRRLVIGGVEIPAESGPVGHSDADALLHAVIDALLGAAGLGDIGGHFPPGDPRWKGADSREMLRLVVAELEAHGWSIGNVDANVIIERPRLAPYIVAIRACLAETLGLDTGRVSVKAKTNERLGPVGDGSAMVAEAVALIERTRN